MASPWTEPVPSGCWKSNVKEPARAAVATANSVPATRMFRGKFMASRVAPVRFKINFGIVGSTNLNVLLARTRDRKITYGKTG
jgi:hypothetical protein